MQKISGQIGNILEIFFGLFQKKCNFATV